MRWKRATDSGQRRSDRGSSDLYQLRSEVRFATQLMQQSLSNRYSHKLVKTSRRQSDDCIHKENTEFRPMTPKLGCRDHQWRIESARRRLKEVCGDKVTRSAQQVGGSDRPPKTTSFLPQGFKPTSFISTFVTLISKPTSRLEPIICSLTFFCSSWV